MSTDPQGPRNEPQRREVPRPESPPEDGDGPADPEAADPPDLMRAGVRARVARLARSAAGGVQRWSPPALVAALCAGAFAPLLTTGLGTAAIASAGVGALSGVGGNVLADVALAALERLGPPEGDEDSEDGIERLEEAVERGVREVLEAGGDRAAELRGEIAEVLREIGAVGAALEGAVRTGDRELQSRLADGLAALGEEFAEFGFVLADLGAQLRLIREAVDRNQLELRASTDLQYRTATDIRLLLERVEVIERRTRAASNGGSGGDVRGAAGGAGSTTDDPYRGLVPFRETDAGVFFGREVLTAELVSDLGRRLGDDSGLLVVTGASGVGKSSLLRAGMLPMIARGGLSEEARNWPRRVIDQPAASPLGRLAALLGSMAGLDAPSVLRELAEDPGRCPLLVRQAVEADAVRRDLPEGAAASSRLILVVDQFEEVFSRSGERADEQSAFVAALRAAATDPSGPGGAPAALVVVAVRGDFLDRCADSLELAGAMRRGTFLVGPMTEAELRSAITGPAQAAGLVLEPGLVDTIVNEVRSPDGRPEPGALPLVSQTMLTVWENREGDRLTLRGYGLTGGVTRAVTTSAETAFAALPARQRELAPLAFHRLTDVSPEGRPTRRTADREALLAGLADEERAGVDAVLDAFAQRRLVVVDGASAHIAHDVLLDSWPRLRAWLEPDLAVHARYSELVRAAEQWERHSRSGSYLFEGERLDGMLRSEEHWREDAARYPLEGAPRGFLDASRRAAHRRRLRRRTALAVLVVLLIATTAAAGIAVRAKQVSDRRRDTAVSQQLAAQSELTSAGSDVSALLAAAAWRVRRTPEARAGMVNVLSRPARGGVLGRYDQVHMLAVAPGGRLVAIAEGSAVRLWDVRAHRQAGATLADAAMLMAFSPDGRVLGTADQNGAVRLWDVRAHRLLGTPLSTGASGSVLSLAFAPDGRTLSAGSVDGTVRLWDTATGNPSGAPLVPGVQPFVLAFAPDGRTLAIAGGTRGTVRLWDVPAGRRIGDLRSGGAETISTLAFSPDGGTLAVASSADVSPTASRSAAPRPASVRLWDVHRRRQLGAPLAEHVWTVDSMVFSPDGRTLATADDDAGDRVRLWGVRTRERLGEPLEGLTKHVVSMAFDPDGHTLTAAGTDAAIMRWDTRAHRQLGSAIATGRYDPSSLAYEIPLMSFAPDGRTLTTLNAFSVSHVWDVASHDAIGAPRRFGADSLAGSGTALSPDGKTVATAGREKDGLRLWDARTGSLIAALPADTAGPMAFGPRGRTVAVVTGKATLQLWDVSAHRPVGGPFTQPTRGTSIDTVVFGPDGRTIATAGLDAGNPAVFLWDVRSRRRTAVLPGHVNVSRAMAFSPDGATIAIADGDDTVRLWDVRTGRQLGTPITGAFQAVAFGPDGRTLATAAGTARDEIRIWDVRTHQPLGDPLTGHISNVSALAFSPDGRTLASTGWDQTLRFWYVGVPGDDDALHAAVCAIPGRSLTKAEWARYAPGTPPRRVCP
jgi:WD40 repeat protein